MTFFRFSLVLILAMSTVVSCTKNKEAKPDPKLEVLGTVNGQKILYKDIEPLIAQELERHQFNLYNIKRTGFDKLAAQKVIGKAASQEGSKPEDYLKFFDENASRNITEAERKQYEEKLGVLISSLPEDKQALIKNEIQRNRIERAKRRLVNELKSRNNVQFTLEEPSQPLRDKRRQEVQAERARRREQARQAAQKAAQSEQKSGQENQVKDSQDKDTQDKDEK